MSQPKFLSRAHAFRFLKKITRRHNGGTLTGKPAHPDEMQSRTDVQRKSAVLPEFDSGPLKTRPRAFASFLFEANALPSTFVNFGFESRFRI
jgi:hypothetical protein